MIRIALTMLMVCAAVEAGEPKRAGNTPPASSASRVRSEAVPAGARKIDENTYAWKDAEGKNWQFRRTPFGWAKIDAQTDSSATPHSTALTPMNGRQTPALTEGENVKVVDNGETVTFVRATPFGKLYDTRKKAELTAEERGLVERAMQRAGAPAQESK